jgi:hypothetical protein
MVETQELPRMPFTVAVIGDSRATNYNAEEWVKAFPDVLAEIAGARLEVRNFARIAHRLDKYLKDMDELLEWCPDIVVNAYGGRETMYRMPKYLKRFPCQPHGSIRGTSFGRMLPLAWVRRQAWRTVLALLEKQPRVGERLMALMKANTYRTTEQYQESMSALVECLRPWGAQVIVMLPVPSRLGEYVFSPTRKATNRAAGSALARQLPEMVSIWDPTDDIDFTGLFLFDRVHLTEEGHRLMAESLLRAIEKLLTRQASEGVTPAPASRERMLPTSEGNPPQ